MMIFIFLLLPFGICYANNYEFPQDFLFGIATSAYQVEGAWNESGKGENIWDKFTHEKTSRISDKSNGDIACDSYHKTKEDVQLLKYLGVDFYRFSLSWSRILPTGYVNKINPDGIKYYNELIDELVKNNITPVVTLYHWDLPQPLQEAGGWPNPFIAGYFADYARVAFRNFGDRVKLWVTVNEPPSVCHLGYGKGLIAPATKSDGFANYMCTYTLVLAHAKAYHIYDKEFRSKQKGQVGISVDSVWYEPKSKSAEDIRAAQLALQTNYGCYTNPIYSKSGDFPLIMKQQIANNSAAQAFDRSRLPSFTAEEIKYIQGSADFLGLNHYTTYLTSFDKGGNTDRSYYNSDIKVAQERDPAWNATSTSWIFNVPWGLRKLLNWIKQEYNNPVVYIMENGMGDVEEIINDVERIGYMKGYLGAVLDAIHKDGCNVKAYTAWTLMDNFEWVFGYTLKFGLYHVDFQDPQRKRTAKASAQYYKKVISTRRIN